jgi:hypothetical protein
MNDRIARHGRVEHRVRQIARLAMRSMNGGSDVS